MDSTQERCRVCLERTESYFSLHKKVPVGEDDVLIAKILINCGDIEVSHNDGKPQNACFACIENAQVAYRFKMMCMQSETTLNTEICNKFINERDPLEFKKENDIIESGNVEICYIKEEHPNLNNVEVCSEDSNDQLEDSSEDTNEQDESNDGDTENAGETEKIQHNCPDCGKSFPFRKQMLKHRLEQHKLRKCRYCDFKAAGKDLNGHMSKMHEDQKTLKCHCCDKQFFKQKNLTRHMISHTDIKNHVCGMCGKTSKTADALRKHMFTHSEEHMLRLSGERPYSCTLCDKRFYKKFDLKRHTNTHTKQRVFKCDVCSKEFCRKSNLQVHLRTGRGCVRAMRAQ